MGPTYTWHPGAIRLNPVWIASTNIQPDEILSSWLVRTALFNGCDPMTLTWDIWPRWRPWTTDIDRGIASNKLSKLIRLSGISKEAFQSATLRPVAELISGAELTSNAVWPWILSVGARGSKRRSGLQYCPCCLDEDERPYFRIQWRLAWHTTCSKHHISLLDRCHSCRRPIQPHLLPAEKKTITICSTCGTDLREGKHQMSPSEIIAFQQTADRAVLEGKGVFSHNELYTLEWFELVRFFSLLMRRLLAGATSGHRRLAEAMGIPHSTKALCSSNDRIELLRVKNRQILLSGALLFIKMSVSELSAILSEVGISRQGFFVDLNYRLSSLLSLYDKLPDNSKRVAKRRRKKPSLLKPTPRHIVERKMARILRLVEEYRHDNS